MRAQKKAPASDAESLQQMKEEIAAMQALIIDHTRELTTTRLGMERLAIRLYELEKGTNDKPDATLTATAPSGIQCKVIEGGIIIYGRNIPLNNDAADAFYHLVCQDGIVTKEHLATLCTSQNTLNKEEHISTGALYQRLRRLKEALNRYHANLGKECILSIPRRETGPDGTTTKQGGVVNDYRFDAEKFRAILGIE